MKIDFEKYNKHVDHENALRFTKIVNRNFPNKAVKISSTKSVDNKLVFTIVSKDPTFDIVLIFKSPFEVAFDFSKMNSQLCEEMESVQDLWYLYMKKLCPNSYRRDYLKFWLHKMKEESNFSTKEDVELLKNYLINKCNDLEYNYTVENSLKELEKQNSNI